VLLLLTTEGSEHRSSERNKGPTDHCRPIRYEMENSDEELILLIDVSRRLELFTQVNCCIRLLLDVHQYPDNRQSRRRQGKSRLGT